MRTFFLTRPLGGSVTSAPLGHKLITKEQVTWPGSGLSSALGGISSSLLLLPPLVRSYFVSPVSLRDSKIDKTRLPFPLD